MVLEASLLAEYGRDKGFVGKGRVDEDLTTAGLCVPEQDSI